MLLTAQLMTEAIANLVITNSDQRNCSAMIYCIINVLYIHV